MLERRKNECLLALKVFCVLTILINFLIIGEKKILPKKATRNVTLAALLIEEVTRRLAAE